jgi:diaminobutyrate-2-oxoglutarate transaminase
LVSKYNTNEEYLRKQAHRESNARSYPRRIPIAIKHAEGLTVTDVEGKTYLDCLAGAGSLALGHNHPVVIEAIQEVLVNKMPLHTLDLMTPLKDELIDELFQFLPTSFAKKAKIQFCGPAGTDAVEAALKLVKTATGKRSVLSFQGAYHGMTHGALGLMGNVKPKESITGLMSDVQFLPYPYAYRCPFGLGGERGVETNLYYIERLLSDPESGIPSPAGLIMEPIQGEGGVIPAPDQWVQGIRKLTQQHQIPLIIDEIQTGIGRTGKRFAFEHAGVLPDVLILSKALGGSLPLSVIVYHEELDQWKPGAHAGTFRGNQLAMAAGIATLRFIREQHLEEHAVKMGERLLHHLRQLQQEVPALGDVRGRGLMIGVEIVNHLLPADHLGSYPANGELARQIQSACLERGLILELGGRHGSVVRFLPPLIVTEEQIDQIGAIFADAVLSTMKRKEPAS